MLDRPTIQLKAGPLATAQHIFRNSRLLNHFNNVESQLWNRLGHVEKPMWTRVQSTKPLDNYITWLIDRGCCRTFLFIFRTFSNNIPGSEITGWYIFRQQRKTLHRSGAYYQKPSVSLSILMFWAFYCLLGLWPIVVWQHEFAKCSCQVRRATPFFSTTIWPQYISTMIWKWGLPKMTIRVVLISWSWIWIVGLQRIVRL